MILDELEVQERIESPMNLLNRLKDSLSSPSARKSDIVSLPPSSEDIIDNLDDKLSHGSLKSKASAIMNSCLDELKTRIPEVQKVEKLAAIAESMNKVITAQTDRKEGVVAPQIVVYAPSFVREESFETIYVRE